MKKKKINQGPRILLFDLETSPLEVYTWSLHEVNVGLNQIIKDWSILSYAAKWLNEDKIIYEDTRNQKDVRDDKKLVKNICLLLDQADVVVTHYGKNFDIPKIDTRRLKHKLPLFSIPKHEDTKQMSNKFSFTSNKLEYIAKYLNTKNKKLTDKRKFVGMELWKGCLNKNKEAWFEMERYNKLDILTLQDVYEQLRPRGSTLNTNVYTNDTQPVCVCGSTSFKENGFAYSATGKYKRFKCKQCHRETRGKTNLLFKEQRDMLRLKV